MATMAAAGLELMPQHWALPSLMVLLALLVAHALLTSWRWQMWPVTAVVAAGVLIGLVVLIMGWAPPGWFRITSLVVATALILLSMALVVGLPVPRIPAPEGPFGIGSVELRITDDERKRFAGADEPGRRLFIKIWYPALAEPAKAEGLWQSVQSSDGIPGPMKLLTRYMTAAASHTVSTARFAADCDAAPVLLYQHGMVSFAAENTVLMEHLASLGLIVVAIQHIDQSLEWAALNSEQSGEARNADAEIMKKLQGPLSRTERAELSRAWFESAVATPTVVHGRALDGAFVLDRLNQILQNIPDYRGSEPEALEVGALGLSLGGAVSARLGQTDSRITAVVNLDGGLFGFDPELSLAIPYLAIHSAGNEGTNDLLLGGKEPGGQEFLLPGSKHADLHDATYLVPALRWVGVTGRRGGLRALHDRNMRVSDFFRAHLGEGHPSRSGAGPACR